MNQYLYPWHDLDGGIEIRTIRARGYTEGREKLCKLLVDQYEELDDTLDYDELIEQLADIYGIYLGDIYDITEYTNDSNSARFR